MARHHQAHQDGRDQKIEQGGNKQGEELAKLHLARLPHHQGGDIAKGTERPSGVGGDHYVDAGKIDKTPITIGHLQHHGAHQERSGQVVCHRRNTKSKPTGQPEQGAQVKAGSHQPGTQGIEQPPILHGVDIGHRHQQEQHQLGIFQQGMAEGLFGCRAHPLSLVGDTDQDPDHPGGHQHGFGLAQLQILFGHHQGVGQHKQSDTKKSD